MDEEREALPPPAETILAYAVLGWAISERLPRTAGWPRLPERAVWVPIFRLMLSLPDWKERLARFAKRGLRHHRVAESIVQHVGPAMDWPDFRDRLREALPGRAEMSGRAPKEPAEETPAQSAAAG